MRQLYASGIMDLLVFPLILLHLLSVAAFAQTHTSSIWSDPDQLEATIARYTNIIIGLIAAGGSLFVLVVGAYYRLKAALKASIKSGNVALNRLEAISPILKVNAIAEMKALSTKAGTEPIIAPLVDEIRLAEVQAKEEGDES